MSKSTPPLDPSPVLFDSPLAKTDRSTPGSNASRSRHRARRQPAPRNQRRGDRPAREDALLQRPARALHRLAPRPRRAEGGPADGQRRYLAAKASHGLAGSEYMQGLAEPIRSLIVLLLDHAPSPEEIGGSRPTASSARNSPWSTSSSSSTTAGRRAPACANPTGSPPSAPTWGSPRSARTTSAASSPSPSDPRPRRRTTGRRADLRDDG